MESSWILTSLQRTWYTNTLKGMLEKVTSTPHPLPLPGPAMRHLKNVPWHTEVELGYKRHVNECLKMWKLLRQIKTFRIYTEIYNNWYFVHKIPHFRFFLFSTNILINIIFIKKYQQAILSRWSDAKHAGRLYWYSIK